MKYIKKFLKLFINKKIITLKFIVWIKIKKWCYSSYYKQTSVWLVLKHKLSYKYFSTFFNV